MHSPAHNIRSSGDTWIQENNFLLTNGYTLQVPFLLNLLSFFSYSISTLKKILKFKEK